MENAENSWKDSGIVVVVVVTDFVDGGKKKREERRRQQRYKKEGKGRGRWNGWIELYGTLIRELGRNWHALTAGKLKYISATLEGRCAVRGNPARDPEPR